MDEDEQRVWKNNLRLFLKDLAALTIKYDIEIGGCGECGSPWVGAEEYLKWHPADGIYTVGYEDFKRKEL